MDLNYIYKIYQSLYNKQTPGLFIILVLGLLLLNVYMLIYFKQKFFKSSKYLETTGLQKQQQYPPIKQVVLIGFGAVQKALLSLMYFKEKWLLTRYPILIIEPIDIQGSDIYLQIKKTNNNIQQLQESLTESNYKQIFLKHINNALIIDLAYRVNTSQIINQAGIYDCLYVNTAIDSWQFSLTPLYDTKQQILKENQNHKNTAILNFGMNPGLISILVKYSLERLVQDKNDPQLLTHIKNNEYNQVANKLGLTMIQISERDNQQSDQRTLQQRFINTWSVVGFIDEAFDYTQISFGTHEKLPDQFDKQYLEQSGQIVFKGLGHEYKTQSYEPKGGNLIGMNIPHAESYSLTEFLRIENKYRPNIHYCYLPSDNAKLIPYYRDFCVNDKLLPQSSYVLQNKDINSGYDSVGALMYFRDIDNVISTIWSGTILSSEQLNQYQKQGLMINELNATTIQVAIGTLSAIVWMLDTNNKENQTAGIIEPEFLPASQILSYCQPFLGSLLINHLCSDYHPMSDQYLDLLQNPHNLRKS